MAILCPSEDLLTMPNIKQLCQQVRLIYIGKGFGKTVISKVPLLCLPCLPWPD